MHTFNSVEFKASLVYRVSYGTTTTTKKKSIKTRIKRNGVNRKDHDSITLELKEWRVSRTSVCSRGHCREQDSLNFCSALKVLESRCVSPCQVDSVLGTQPGPPARWVSAPLGELQPGSVPVSPMLDTLLFRLSSHNA